MIDYNVQINRDDFMYAIYIQQVDGVARVQYARQHEPGPDRRSWTEGSLLVNNGHQIQNPQRVQATVGHDGRIEVVVCDQQYRYWYSIQLDADEFSDWIPIVQTETSEQFHTSPT